jgi:hypothetical protein
MTIQNQQPNISHIVSLNGQEITEHNRKVSVGLQIQSTDIEMSKGNKQRYILKNKNTYSFSFSYLPSLSNKTIDGRQARDYLVSLMSLRSKISLSIKLDPTEPFYNTLVYADSYTETLVRRDVPNSCSYYDVEIVFIEA